MKRLLVSLLISILAVGLIWLAYAAWGEGVELPEAISNETSRRPQVLQSDQGLPVGKYIVYQTKEIVDYGQSDLPDDDKEKYTFWRYRLGDNQPEMIVSVINDRRTTIISPQARKFSKESFVLWTNQQEKKASKKIYHLNGSLVGPAEDFFGLISPNRQWLVYQEGIKVILKNISSQDKEEIAAEVGLRPEAWSDDSSKIYLTSLTSDKEVTGLWIFDLKERQLHSLTDKSGMKLFSTKIYPKQKKAIGYVYSGDGSGGERQPPGIIELLDLKDGSVRQLLFNQDKVMVNPQLSPTGQFFSYTYADDANIIWLASTLDTQQRKEQVKIFGTVLDWPTEDSLLLSADGKLQIYSIKNQTVFTLASNQDDYQAADYLVWQYLGLFEIK